MTVLLISGSTRVGSTNTAMLRTVHALAPEITMPPYDGLRSLPAFSTDDDHDPLPDPVHRLRVLIGASTGVLFCTPEYAGALPGAFKNLLDWTVGDASTDSMHGKPVGWLNVSGPTAPAGGADAHDSLVKVMRHLRAVVIEQACRRIPLTRLDVDEDGLVHHPGARVDALHALHALNARNGRSGG